jgi:UDP-perosamine 4-acetyltransferase
MKCRVILIGGGGHARVLIDALRLTEVEIVGIIDQKYGEGFSSQVDVTVLGNDDAVLKYDPIEIRLVNAVGSISSTLKRKMIFEKFQAMGYRFQTVIHPSAVIASDVQLEEGVQVLAGAVIQTGSRIGANTIVNTKASVDHDCLVGRHVHLAPGVTLSGGVAIGDEVHMGTGSVVIQNIRVTGPGLVRAGSVVIQDLSLSARDEAILRR